MGCCGCFGGEKCECMEKIACDQMIEGGRLLEVVSAPPPMMIGQWLGQWPGSKLHGQERKMQQLHLLCGPKADFFILMRQFHLKVRNYWRVHANRQRDSITK